MYRRTPPGARVLDRQDDPYRGAVAVAQIVDGDIRVGDVVTGLADGGTVTSEVLELGLMTPEPLKMTRLRAGHVGYVITSSRDARSAKIGDTLVRAKDAKTAPRRVAPLPGFRPAKPMVFQGLFPASADQHDALRAAVERLALNDASVTTAPETSGRAGTGVQAASRVTPRRRLPPETQGGIRRRRHQHGADRPLPSARRGEGRGGVVDGDHVAVGVGGCERGSRRSGRNRPRAATVEEPMVDATIICASDAVGTIVELCVDRRGAQLEHAHLDDTRGDASVPITPRRGRVRFQRRAQIAHAGFATFDYEDAGWEPSDVVRLDVRQRARGGRVGDVGAQGQGDARGREMCRRLKDALPRQLYEVAVQAAVGGKVLARETISAMRKNVLAKCYGGTSVERRNCWRAKGGEAKDATRRQRRHTRRGVHGLLSTNNR